MLKSLKLLFSHSHLIPFYLILLLLLIYFTKFSYKNISALNLKVKKILIYCRIIVWAILILALINPLIQYFFNRTEKNSIVLLMDNSLSMMIRDRDDRSRFAKAKKILNGPTINYLNKNFNMQYFLFNSGLLPFGRDNILKEKEPAGDMTDIGGALLKISQSGGKYLDNIILLSDGINNVYHDMTRIAEQLKKKNIKIYSVKLDDNENIKDISLMEIECPPEVSINTKLNLNIKINAFKYNNVPITLQVFLNDKIDSTLVVNVKEGINQAAVPVNIKEMGINKITVNCSSKPDESILINNSKTVFVRAIKNKFRVLLIYGQPSFEYKFLKYTMDNDPNISADTYMNLSGNLKELQNLMKYDLIMIGNIKYKNIPGPLAEDIFSYANNKNGALLFLGGRNSFKNGDYHISKLKEVIPVEWDKSGECIKSDFTLKLTPSGLNSPAMHIVADTDKLQGYWDNLPPCNLINVIKKVRKGADILAVHSKDPDMVVFALGLYKRTRVGIFTAYPTWKWGFLNLGIGYNENPFNIFWQQLIRYMVNFNLEKVNLFTNKLIYRKNEDIFTTLTLFDDENQPVKMDKISLILFKKIKDEYQMISVPFYLYPSPSSGGLYETIVNCTEDGEYKLKVNIGKYKAETFFLISKPAEELYILNADNKLLDSLSGISGGKFLELGAINQLKDLIKEKVIKRRIKKETDLWSNWFLFFLVIGFLSLEWYLRKKNGLM